MDIVFKNTKLKKICSQSDLAKRKWGTQTGRRLMRRLDEMRAADNLAVLMTLPQARCHELKGSRRRQFSVDLEHPYRLIFEPADSTIPMRPDGSPDLQQISAVRILGVEDTHG